MLPLGGQQRAGRTMVSLVLSSPHDRARITYHFWLCADFHLDPAANLLRSVVGWIVNVRAPTWNVDPHHQIYHLFSTTEHNIHSTVRGLCLKMLGKCYVLSIYIPLILAQPTSATSKKKKALQSPERFWSAKALSAMYPLW